MEALPARSGYPISPMPSLGVTRLPRRTTARPDHLWAPQTFIGHPDVLKDFGYRAIKVTTDNSKAIIKRLTGKNPRYSYFSGCSDGGREALIEAQRYPKDFDGIIVGSPANDLAGLGASFLWNMQALLAGPRKNGVPEAYIPADKIALLSRLAISKCAGKDGGVSTDAFLNDPTICHFDAAVAQCAAGQRSRYMRDTGASWSRRKALQRASQFSGGAVVSRLRARHRVERNGLARMAGRDFVDLSGKPICDDGGILVRRRAWQAYLSIPRPQR